MKRICLATALAGPFVLGGCAPNHFVKGHPLAPAQSVDIATLPAGALARTAQGNTCITPCRLPLLTADGGEIDIALEGYRTERHYVGARVSQTKLAYRSANLALEAIDPDPVSIGLDALADVLAGKGAVQELDVRRIFSELVPLAEGEQDLLADAKPLTGERIPIDLSESPDR